MTQYSINPAGVAAVLAKTSADRDTLFNTYKAFPPALDYASTSTGGSEIPGALAEVVAYLDRSRESSDELIAQCIDAAEVAVSEYDEADAEMAEQYPGGN